MTDIIDSIIYFYCYKLKVRRDTRFRFCPDHSELGLLQSVVQRMGLSDYKGCLIAFGLGGRVQVLGSEIQSPESISE